MKMKNVVVAILCVIVAQSVCAKEFQVVNMVGKDIQIHPYWTGSSDDFVKLMTAPSGLSPAPMTFDPGRHHLIRIDWNDGTACYKANVEHLTSGFGRFRSMVIRIYKDGMFRVDIGSGEGIPTKADKGNC